MSDDESFVILSSSPLSYEENGGKNNEKNSSQHSSLETDTPGSNFSSLKSSQLSALQSAQETSTHTPNNSQEETPVFDNTRGLEQNMKSLNLHDKQLIDCAISQIISKSNEKEREEIAGSKLWIRQPQVKVEENMFPLSLENSKSYSEQHQVKTTESVQQSTAPISTGDKVNSYGNKTSLRSPVESNLATSFIMGEINADVLKTSVYSQFPSISVDASAEDVVKLQNMVTEYMQLKTTIKKAGNTMKLFYDNSLQWKEKMQTMEEQYKQQLGSFQREVEVLRKQNQELEISFKSQIEALEIARKKDREETVQAISEKNALLENLRAQIIKLEQQQLASFEFVASNPGEQKNEIFEKYYITRQEHELKMKNIERKLSEMLARNLDLKDVENQYLDELNCLKVNLTAAEELINKHRAEINQLHALDTERKKHIQVLENSLDEMRVTNAEQTERISLLEHQNEVHRKDFEMEKESRQTVLKEKQQTLQDLRNLQRKNQELIEEHSKISQKYEKRILSSVSAAENNTQIVAAAAAAQAYLNNPQRPIRTLPSSPGTPTTTPPVSMHLCPICNKAFKSLNILQSHVNDCIDRN